MDAIQFGRWLSERRRLYGWNSQRALVETARQHPFLNAQNISEDFLARLEAGQFVHPFRGSVRRRVLSLASLLCKTPREVKSYLRAAALTELNSDETHLLNRLSDHLATWSMPTPFPLPPRPLRLFGRASLVEELVNTLSTLETGLCALTGMAGVGKSVLAYEVMHHFATNEREHLRIFPDGIVTFTCKGRQGRSGLISMLTEIADAFSRSRPKHAGLASPLTAFSQVSPASSDGELAEAIDRVRLTIANKHLLLLLDDVDAQFPLRLLLDALFAQDQNGTRDQGRSEIKLARRIVLTTSRYIPAPTLLAAHFHVGPLEPEAALDLFMILVGYPLPPEELTDAQRLCAALGYLPLAIEVAAAAVKTSGIPLPLLAARVAQRPLDRLLDGEQELRAVLNQALEHLDTGMQQRFVLLSTLGTQPFGLESAAALRSTSPGELWLPEHAKTRAGNGISVAVVEEHAADQADQSLAQLANAAADLGQFVRHSLVELIPGQNTSPSLAAEQLSHKNGTRYQLHPLLYAHALDRLSQLEPDVVNAAERNIQTYAQEYLERYQGDLPGLERESEFLLTALEQAWQQEQYSLVVHFVSRLLFIIGRHGNYNAGKRILGWGIHACQRLQDRYHLASFMNRLAILYLYCGELTLAKETWESCLEIATSLHHNPPACLWFPLANMAILARIHDEYANAQCLVDAYLRRVHNAEPGFVAHGFLARGMYARLQGKKDQAYDDVQSSMQLLSQNVHTATHKRLMIITAQTELARVQQDYARSQEYTNAALSIIEETSDFYDAPETLLEQARYAHQQGMLNDARTLAQRAASLAEQLGAPELRGRCILLLKQLSSISLP